MELSVVIPVYKTPPALFEKCIRSVLSPQGFDVECIIVVDSPGDPIEKLIMRYAEEDSRIRVVSNEVNLGPSLSRNRGIDIARGEYLLIVDSDDEIIPEVCIRALKICAEKQLDCCSLARINPWMPTAYKDLQRFMIGGITPKQYGDGDAIVRAIDMSSSGVIYRRDFLNSKGLRYNENLRVNEDFEFITRLVFSGARLAVSDKIGYKVSFHADSLSHNTLAVWHSTDPCKAALSVMAVIRNCTLSRSLWLFYSAKVYGELFGGKRDYKLLKTCAHQYVKVFSSVLTPIAGISMRLLSDFRLAWNNRLNVGIRVLNLIRRMRLFYRRSE